MNKNLFNFKVVTLFRVLSDNEYNFLKDCHIAMLYIYMFMVYLKTVSVASRIAYSM